jgi:glycine oxidase
MAVGNGSSGGVVVCGAGIVGAAVAYYLSRRGIPSLVIEAREVAYGASGRAAGLLTPLDALQLREPWGPLASLSLDLHRALALELDGGATYAYEARPALTVAQTDEEAAVLRSRAVPGSSEWIEPADVRRRNPWLDRELAGGLALHGAAVLDPGALTRVLLDRAGAELRHGAVAGFETSAGRLSAVQVDGVLVSCDKAVITMGPWSAAAAQWMGVEVPVAPLKGQILHLHPPEPAPPGSFADLDGNYVAAKPGGIVFAGTTEEHAGFDTSPTAEARDAILASLGRLTSRLEGAMIVGHTACLRPITGDGSPLIGPSPVLPGAFIAAGHGRKGILMSLATGKAVAELVATGACSVLDLAPFDPGRFGPHQPPRST